MFESGIEFVDKYIRKREVVLDDGRIIEVNINDENVQVKCTDCNGTGIFILPNDAEEMCVPCKGTGKIWINIL